jgi:hypothetical protein
MSRTWKDSRDEAIQAAADTMVRHRASRREIEAAVQRSPEGMPDEEYWDAVELAQKVGHGSHAVDFADGYRHRLTGALDYPGPARMAHQAGWIAGNRRALRTQREQKRYVVRFK